jgi:uncharacterized membrane protein
VARVLRTGVLVAGTVVLVGGIYYVMRHGGEREDYSKFVAVAREDRSLRGILGGVVRLRARSVIQLGVLLLIATPVLRVAVALVGFGLEKDKQYAVIACVVLAVLIYSLVS